MKSLATLAISLVALISQVAAHYTFGTLLVNGSPAPLWQNVRRTNNYNTRHPVTDVNSADIRCFTSETGATAQTATVNAGDTVGFRADEAVYHASTTAIYAARAPGDVTNWSGDGAVWFKLWELPAVTDGGNSISFPSEGRRDFTVTLPRSLPSGQYLLRIENIALHQAQNVGGAQFYIACGQLNVNNGGNGNPGPTVAFPGVSIPCIGAFISQLVYYPVPTSYIQPGPPVWTG